MPNPRRSVASLLFGSRMRQPPTLAFLLPQHKLRLCHLLPSRPKRECLIGCGRLIYSSRSHILQTISLVLASEGVGHSANGGGVFAALLELAPALWPSSPPFTFERRGSSYRESPQFEAVPGHRHRNIRPGNDNRGIDPGGSLQSGQFPGGADSAAHGASNLEAGGTAAHHGSRGTAAHHGPRGAAANGKSRPR